MLIRMRKRNNDVAILKSKVGVSGKNPKKIISHYPHNPFFNPTNRACLTAGRVLPTYTFPASPAYHPPGSWYS